MSNNERARARAIKRGVPTYKHEVLEHWPACVDCAQPIRRPAPDHRMARLCGCEGVVWTYKLGTIATPDAWVKIE